MSGIYTTLPSFHASGVYPAALTYALALQFPFRTPSSEHARRLVQASSILSQTKLLVTTSPPSDDGAQHPFGRIDVYYGTY